MQRLFLLIWMCCVGSMLYGQQDTSEMSDEDYYEMYPEPLNDPSSEGQRFFVEDLLDVAGYVLKRIEIYQTLPNNARVFRVKFDSINGAFMFVRWDKKNKENVLANKLIDPGVYLNLKTAQEIMRKQTDQASFSVNDVSLQASDQEQINSGELQELREEFKLKEEEKKLQEMEERMRQKMRSRRRKKRN